MSKKIGFIILILAALFLGYQIYALVAMDSGVPEARVSSENARSGMMGPALQGPQGAGGGENVQSEPEVNWDDYLRNHDESTENDPGDNGFDDEEDPRELPKEDDSA